MIITYVAKQYWNLIGREISGVLGHLWSMFVMTHARTLWL